MNATFTLINVTYELFEFETELGYESLLGPVHELDKQVRLTDDAGDVRYVSWGNFSEEYQDYGVGFLQTSFFYPPDYERDMTHSDMWADFIGKVITCEMSEWYQLEIRTSDRVLYCYTKGDVIAVSSQTCPFRPYRW